MDLEKVQKLQRALEIFERMKARAKYYGDLVRDSQKPGPATPEAYICVVSEFMVFSQMVWFLDTNSLSQLHATQLAGLRRDAWLKARLNAVDCQQRVQFPAKSFGS